MLQNTARKRRALAVVGAEAGGEVEADGQQGEVHGAGGDEHEADRLDRPPPVAGPAHGQREAGQRDDGEGHGEPAGERRQPHRGVDRCALGDPDGHVRGRRRDSDSASSRVDERRGACLTISPASSTSHEQTAATALDDRRVQLPDAGVEHALERVGRHEIGDDRLDDRPGGDGELGRRRLLLELVGDLLGDGLADRRLLEHVGGDIGETLGAGERAPAPQRDHRQVEQQDAHQEQRSRPAAEHAETTPLPRPPSGRL